MLFSVGANLMSKRLFFCVLGVVAYGLEAQTLSVDAVVNAASNLPSQLPYSSVAQGALFIVYGNDLGPANLVQATYPLPAAAGLAGTIVAVSVNGQSAPAPILYTSQTQIAAVLPSTTPIGSGSVTVTYNGQSGSSPIQVSAAAFGIFSANQGGYGPASATLPDGSPIGIYHPVKPGQTFTLWGTGLGAIAGADNIPPTPIDLGTPVQVWVADQPAQVLYRGRSASCAGVDQINIVMPPVEGCVGPVVVQIGNTMSNYVTIASASNGEVCNQPFEPRYSAAFLTDLLSGPRNFASVFSEKGTYFGASALTPYEGVGFDAFRITAADLQRQALDGLPQVLPLGTCMATPYKATHITTALPPNLINPQGLDAGPSMQVVGRPGSVTMKLTPNVPQLSLGVYSGMYGTDVPMGFLESGTETVQGTGGSDVGPFSVTIDAPPPFTWTNADSISTIRRDQPLTVTWTGGDPAGYVAIEGLSYVTASTGAGFGCYVPISAGQFTIPARLLSMLPASNETPGGSVIGLSSYSMPATFHVPEIDLGTSLTNAIMISRPVTYQ